MFCLMGATGFAEKNKEPLPDYVAQFTELDTKLRGIDSRTSCTNYLAWMDNAIEAKRELRLRDEIEPWLEDLATTHSNNWKILHAAATGYMAIWERSERWEAIQLLDRAFKLTRVESPPDAEMGRLCTDYIGILRSGDIQLKTPGTPRKEYSKNAINSAKSTTKKSALFFMICPPRTKRPPTMANWFGG